MALRFWIVATLCTVLYACSSSSRMDTINQGNVGFIGDYSKFEAIETNDGLKSFRYASAGLRSGSYSNILIDKVDFYPLPAVKEEVDMALLEQIKAYVDAGLAAASADTLKPVGQAQANTLRFTPRITAIETTPGDVRVRELIPIGTVLAIAKAARGTRHRNIELYVEIKVTDSLTGEFLGGSVKQGRGNEVTGKRVEFEDLRPLLDIWIRDFEDVFSKLARHSDAIASAP